MERQSLISCSWNKGLILSQRPLGVDAIMTQLHQSGGKAENLNI